MIDITPSTDSNTQVTVGDNVAVRWRLKGHANPRDIDLIVKDLSGTTTTYSGSDLTETQVDMDGERWWRYTRTVELPCIFTRVEFRLDDAYNKARDTASIKAEQQIS